MIFYLPRLYCKLLYSRFHVSVCILCAVLAIGISENMPSNDARALVADVSDRVKQHVVYQFLSEEKASVEEIKNRLRSIYGENIVDVSQVATPDEREAWTLDKRVRERIVIQFLTAEKVFAKEIYARLKKVYGDCLPSSTVQRWAKQFRDGRINVGRKPLPKG